MQIRGIENLSTDEINFELQRGARFVVFEFCISVLIMTFKNPTAVFFVRQGESAVSKGLPYSLCSLLLGWWGLPWGPIYTISSLVTNFRGGRDVTLELVEAMNHAGPEDEAETRSA